MSLLAVLTPDMAGQSSDEDLFHDPEFDLAITQLLEDRVPKGTQSSNQWALNSFNKWLSGSIFGNQFSNFDDIPPTRLNYILECFVVSNTETYKYKTMHNLLRGLNRRLKELTANEPDELDLFESKMFLHFRNVLDGWIKGKQCTEETRPTKSATLTTDQEMKLFKFVFNKYDPMALLQGITYLACKMFCTRGGDELSTITIETISVKRVDNNWKVCYIEKKSKNKQGGLAAINRERKEVLHFDPLNTPHTFTDYYLTLLSRSHPSVVTNGSGVRLFQHPIRGLKPDTQSIWFNHNRPLGKNYFNSIFKSALDKVGIKHDEPGQEITLRSIRSSVIHNMSKHRVHPEVMRQRTGHSTHGALNAYTRFQKEENSMIVSNILNKSVVQAHFINKITTFVLGFIASLVIMVILNYISSQTKL